MGAAQGLLSEAGRCSWGGDSDWKHSPRERLELVWSPPKRNGGSCPSGCGLDEPVVKVLAFIRVRDGRRGAAILRLRSVLVGGAV